MWRNRYALRAAGWLVLAIFTATKFTGAWRAIDTAVFVFNCALDLVLHRKLTQKSP